MKHLCKLCIICNTVPMECFVLCFGEVGHIIMQDGNLSNNSKCGIIG